MEYLFLKRKKASFVSQRQKDLLFDAAEKQWRKEFVAGGIETRKVDLDIYKSLLYFLEINAKELLRAGNCPLKELPQRSGFTSKSAFYAAFGRQSGYTPKRYMTYKWKNEMQDN